MYRVEMAQLIMNGYKMQTAYLLVILAAVVPRTFAQFPLEFMGKCKVSDEKFDECVLNSANKYMALSAKDDNEYGIPRTLLENATKVYNFTENFHIKYINLLGYCYGGIAITSIHFDFDATKTLTFLAKCPQARHTSEFEASGEILGKPVHETGKVNMTFDDMEFNATVGLDFKMKDDKKYLEVVSCKIGATVKDFQYNPYDQVTVGEPMTDEQKKEYLSYIDKFPEIVNDEAEKLDKVVVESLNIVFDKLPYDLLFLP